MHASEQMGGKAGVSGKAQEEVRNREKHGEKRKERRGNRGEKTQWGQRKNRMSNKSVYAQRKLSRETA